MQTPYSIQLLGGLRVRHGEHEITRFPTRKSALLLAYLAYFPRRLHSREDLADLLWPESDIEAGRLRLRVALNALRRQLESPGGGADSLLIADRTHISLNRPLLVTDVGVFESALQSAARAADRAERAA